MISTKNCDEQYYPSVDLQTALQKWWMIVLCMLLGTLLGWVVSRFQPVTYEARAIININIDIARTGTLTGENQDILVNSAGEIIKSYPILSALKQEVQQTTQLSSAELDRMFAMERMAESFALRVQSPDPQIAEKMADEWTRLALAALDNASQNALEVEMDSRYLDALSSCLAAFSASGQDQPVCAVTSLDNLQEEITRTGAAIQQAKDGARGLTAGVNYALNQPAQLQPKPVQNNRLQLLLGGALLGLVGALLMLHNQWPRVLFGNCS